MLGIKFASLNVPLERRLQTLAVGIGAANYFLCGAAGLLLFLYLLFSDNYYVAVLYGVWLWYDQDICERGGRRSEWLRGWRIWKKTFDYFPIQLIKTADLDTNKNYIIGCHPHGVAAFGIMANFLTNGGKWQEYFSGIKINLLALKLHLYLPFIRDYLLAAGVVASSKVSISHLLTKRGTGNAVVVLPGGSAEVYEAHPNTAVLVLSRRKGFVKMALTYGASLVPVYTFGETDLYSQIPNPEGSLIRKIQIKFKNIFGIPLLLVNGRGFFQYSFGLLPRRMPMFTVVGRPIDVERIDNPSQEDIDKYHALYVECLRNLFDEYKVKLGGSFKDQELIIN